MGPSRVKVFEDHLLMIALLLIVSIAGPGRFSVDLPGTHSRYLD